MAHAYSSVMSALGVGLLGSLLCHCGPYHEGGGSGGSSAVGGASPIGGFSGSGGAGVAGSSGGTTSVGGAENTAGSGGEATAGSGGSGVSGSGGSGVSGSGGSSPGLASEPVVGCEAATWPEAGYYFEGPVVSTTLNRQQGLLARFRPDGISGDGQLVVGHTDDLPSRRGVPLAWSAAGGIKEPEPSLSETYATQASCDGSVLLMQSTTFNQAYRVEGDQSPVPIFNGGAPPGLPLLTNPDMSIFVNGYGIDTDEGTVPLRWTATSGVEFLYGLLGNTAYNVAPDGTLLVADTDALYQWDPLTGVRTPVGMSPVDLDGGWRSFRGSADGKAWIQSADLHYSSFLVWRAGAEPRSVSCPYRCRLADLSGTGQIALVDIMLHPDEEGPSTSSIWTEETGLIDLTALFEQYGFDFHGQTLHAVAMSDDGRAFAGNLYAPPPAPYVEYSPFFYAVLPAAAYTSPGQPPGQCTNDWDCEPSADPCQVATCVQSRCLLEPITRGAVCDDGLFCTDGVICDASGACVPGGSPCQELAPGIPRCNEAERRCEVCTDGRPLVNGECRCPFWNCLARGGATYCSETDQTEENQVSCYFDGVTTGDFTPVPEP